MDPAKVRCRVKPILTQKKPVQPCFLLPDIIDLQEGRKPPTPHLDPFIPMWMMNHAIGVPMFWQIWKYQKIRQHQSTFGY